MVRAKRGMCEGKVRIQISGHFWGRRVKCQLENLNFLRKRLGGIKVRSWSWSSFDLNSINDLTWVNLCSACQHFNSKLPEDWEMSAKCLTHDGTHSVDVVWPSNWVVPWKYVNAWARNDHYQLNRYLTLTPECRLLSKYSKCRVEENIPNWRF